jgi:hypothetical protein
LRKEAIVPWNRRISSGLSVRSRGDEVSIATRNTGLRVLFAAALVAAVLLYWYLWWVDAFHDWYPSNVVIAHSIIFVPIALLGVFYAFPGQRLLASKSLGSLEVQHCWLGVPIIRRRVEVDGCHRVSIAALRKEEEVEEDFSAQETILAAALDIVSPAGLGFLWIVRKTTKALVPVYAIQIIRRDGSSIVSHLTWSGEDCLRAMDAVWSLFPELAPKPLVDTVGEGLTVGDRVRISLDHGWARGATGVVKEPPPAVARFGAPWDGLRRYEERPSGRTIFYWIRFDEPQKDAAGDGPHKAAEIDSRYLDRL